MWHQLITQECIELCIYSDTMEAWDSWKYEGKMSRGVCAVPKDFLTPLEVTNEEMQNSSHIQSLDLNKSVVTL